MYFVVLIDFASLLGPIPIAHAESIFAQSGQHHNNDAALFPDHLPEVGFGSRQGALGHDVRRIAWVVISLANEFQNSIYNGH